MLKIYLKPRPTPFLPQCRGERKHVRDADLSVSGSRSRSRASHQVHVSLAVDLNMDKTMSATSEATNIYEPHSSILLPEQVTPETSTTEVQDLRCVIAIQYIILLAICMPFHRGIAYACLASYEPSPPIPTNPISWNTLA